MAIKALQQVPQYFSHASLAPQSAAMVAPAEPSSRTAPFSVLSERRALLSACRSALSSLFDEHTGVAQAELTHSGVDAKLRDAARLTAELLEFAEGNAERASSAVLGALGPKGMRKLADACFDGILNIDAARQDLGASFQADAAFQRLHRSNALRTARDVVADIEAELGRLLAD